MVRSLPTCKRFRVPFAIASTKHNSSNDSITEGLTCAAINNPGRQMDKHTQVEQAVLATAMGSQCHA